MTSAGGGGGPRRLARDVLALGLILATCYLAAGVASMASPSPELDPWYRDLAKPAWTPPGMVFGIVWPLLYTLMAVAAWLVWRADRVNGAARWALSPFAFQLGLNVAWPWAFFGLQSPALGVIVILALGGALVWTMQRFSTVSRLATGLLAPYLAWVAFAFILNATILLMNL